MPKFSASSLAKLETCHPDLQKLFHEVILHFDCTVAEGHRGEEAQNRAYADGYSKLKYPNGKHNAIPSLAVDVYPYPINLSPQDAKQAEIYKYRMAYFAGQVKAIARDLKARGIIAHDILWGCDWNDDTELRDHGFLDFPHFEIIT